MSNTASAASKINFVVSEENVFGYVLPEVPDQLQILASKPQRGATCSWMDGSIPLDNARPASRSDFHDFRIGIEQYEANGCDGGRYEIPTA